MGNAASLDRLSQESSTRESRSSVVSVGKSIRYVMTKNRPYIGARTRSESTIVSKLFLTVLILALSMPSGITAQTPTGRLAVTVVTEAGVPVEGARVSAGERGNLTGASGQAELTIPSGAATLHIERIGYAETDVAVSVPAGGEVEVRVVLETEAFEIEEVVVTSTRSGRRIEDEPLRVEVIGREEVEEKLLMTPGDIAMRLNETAGLRVQTTSPSLGGASVRIQGLRGRYTLLLADGLPLYGGQSGALGPLQIPPMDLGQVEVIKGVASALYGSTALGGVVNLISRSPQSEREILFNATTRGGGDAVLWLADDPEGPWGWSLLGGLHGQITANVDDDPWADLPSFRRVVVRPRVVWDDGEGRTVRATIGTMLEDRRGGTVDGGLTSEGTSFSEELNTRRVDAGVIGRFLTGSGALFSVRSSGSYQRHEHGFGNVTERDRHLTAFAEMSFSATDGAHTWVLGGALQTDAYRATDVAGFDYTHTVPSLFVQDEVSLTQSFVVSGSARLDRHNVYGTFVSPRLSALLRPGLWTVRVSAGGGYFAPTPLLDEGQAVGLGRLGALPADLKAERGRSASLDVGRQAGPMELNVTLFGSRVNDPVIVSPLAGGRLSLENGSDPVRTWGTELLARYHAAPFHVTSTYVFTRSTEVVGGIRSEVPLTPRHTAGVVGAWEDEAWGRIGLEFYLTGRQELEGDPFRSRSRRYLIAGVMIERRFTSGVRLFLNAENLLDARQTRWSPLLRPDRTPDGRWVTDVWAPLDGRTFNAGVRVRF
ncbi:MAG TPA: TonB-dependent receptor [Gemmatimonadetes bacterium]|nr:TonB-dependent receptor [Gemmatimonadota bacterium]